MGARLDDLLQFAHQDLKETLLEQQGMTFKYKKENGRFIHTFCAGQLLSKFGLHPRLVIGRELREFLPANLAIQKEPYYAAAWEGKEDVFYEGEYEGLYYIVSLRPIRKLGQVVEVIASCIDITERKKEEEELRATKELLESLIENSVDGICITDMQGRVMRVNEAFKLIYGWTDDELIGSQALIFPKSMMYDLETICRQLQSGKKAIHFETTIQHQQRDQINVGLTVSPIRDADNHVVALTCIARDITERKRAEDFYRRADKLNVVGQLAAGLAHEIRNPLTSLRGFLQLLQTDPIGKARFFNILISEVDRINTIVNELLQVAKPHEITFQYCSMETILQHVVNLLEAQAALNDIQIHVDVEGRLPFIMASELEMKQIFVNLIKNAMEAMPQGGNIHIKAEYKTDHILIRFVDQGIGMDEQCLQRLAEPFFTTKEKGMGLGLMMCYKIIEEHKGRIDISSLVGQGTTIDIRLPAV